MSWALGVSDVARGIPRTQASSRSQDALAVGRRRAFQVSAAGKQSRRTHSAPPPDEPKEASAVEPLGDALVVKKEPQRLVRTSYRRKKVEKDAAAGGLEPKDDEYGSDSDMLPLTAVGVVLVDGYNVCGAWPKLQKHFRRGELEDARMKLLDACTPYGRANDVDVIVVFDSHINGSGQESKMNLLGVEVVFSGKATADAWIENKVTELAAEKKAHVTVVTSDNALQTAVYSKGGYVRSTSLFIQELKDLQKQEVEMNLTEFKYQQTSLADGLSSSAVEGLLLLRKQLAPNDPFYQKYIVPYDKVSGSKAGQAGPAVTASKSVTGKPRAQPAGARQGAALVSGPSEPLPDPALLRQSVSSAAPKSVVTQGMPDVADTRGPPSQALTQAQKLQAVGRSAQAGQASGGSKTASETTSGASLKVDPRSLLSGAPEESSIPRLRRGNKETGHNVFRKEPAEGPAPSARRAHGHDGTNPGKTGKEPPVHSQVLAGASRKEPREPPLAEPPSESRAAPAVPIVITKSNAQLASPKKGKGKGRVVEVGGEGEDLLELMRRDWEAREGGAGGGGGGSRGESVRSHSGQGGFVEALDAGFEKIVGRGTEGPPASPRDGSHSPSPSHSRSQSRSDSHSNARKGKGSRRHIEIAAGEGTRLEATRRANNVGSTTPGSKWAPRAAGNGSLRAKGVASPSDRGGDRRNASPSGQGRGNGSAAAQHSEAATGEGHLEQGGGGAEDARRSEEPCCSCSAKQGAATSRQGDLQHLCSHCREAMSQQGLVVKKSRQKQSLWEFSGSLGDHRSMEALQALKENLRRRS